MLWAVVVVVVVGKGRHPTLGAGVAQVVPLRGGHSTPRAPPSSLDQDKDGGGAPVSPQLPRPSSQRLMTTTPGGRGGGVWEVMVLIPTMYRGRTPWIVASGWLQPSLGQARVVMGGPSRWHGRRWTEKRMRMRRELNMKVREMGT